MMSIVMTIRKTALGIPRQVSVSSLVRLQKIRVDEVIFKEKTRNFKFLQEKKELQISFNIHWKAQHSNGLRDRPLI